MAGAAVSIKSTITLTNRGTEEATVTVDVLGDDGVPVEVGFEGTMEVIATDGQMATLGLDQDVVRDTLTDLPDIQPRGEAR